MKQEGLVYCHHKCSRDTIDPVFACGLAFTRSLKRLSVGNHSMQRQQTSILWRVVEKRWAIQSERRDPAPSNLRDPGKDTPSKHGIVLNTPSYTGPTALTQSDMATGIQQTVFSIGAETAFDCPAQWIAERRPRGALSLATYPSSRYGRRGTLRERAIVSGNNTVINWPQLAHNNPIYMNLNTTGRDVSFVTFAGTPAYYVRSGPGVMNNFGLPNFSRGKSSAVGYEADQVDSTTHNCGKSMRQA
ncbi:hypothetical protein CHU98_g748 [Xylaria longipes]|nr:hypothetical protein CHU98_g748 [Xylaria longipes]